jgi:hypothetical protein
MRPASNCARKRHVRAVLLGAADRNDDRALARTQRVAHLGAAQVLQVHAGRRGAKGRRMQPEAQQGGGKGKAHGGGATAAGA